MSEFAAWGLAFCICPFIGRYSGKQKGRGTEQPLDSIRMTCHWGDSQLDRDMMKLWKYLLSVNFQIGGGCGSLEHQIQNAVKAVEAEAAKQR